MTRPPRPSRPDDRSPRWFRRAVADAVARGTLRPEHTHGDAIDHCRAAGYADLLVAAGSINTPAGAVLISEPKRQDLTPAQACAGLLSWDRRSAAQHGLNPWHGQTERIVTGSALPRCRPQPQATHRSRSVSHNSHQGASVGDHTRNRLRLSQAILEALVRVARTADGHRRPPPH